VITVAPFGEKIISFHIIVVEMSMPSFRAIGAVSYILGLFRKEGPLDCHLLQDFFF